MIAAQLEKASVLNPVRKMQFSPPADRRAGQEVRKSESMQASVLGRRSCSYLESVRTQYVASAG